MANGKFAQSAVTAMRAKGALIAAGGAQVAFLKDTQKSTYSGLLLRSQGGLAKEK